MVLSNDFYNLERQLITRYGTLTDVPESETDLLKLRLMANQDYAGENGTGEKPRVKYRKRREAAEYLAKHHEEVVKMLKNLKSLAKIAQKFEVSRGGARYYVKTAGLDPIFKKAQDMRSKIYVVFPDHEEEFKTGKEFFEKYGICATTPFQEADRRINKKYKGRVISFGMDNGDEHYAWKD